MKIRIKFEKLGSVKFLGHLDTMRYFQKAIRRAEIPVAYSQGYSPHMIMSFAVPLGVGMESMGDYFDIELTKEYDFKKLIEELNKQMVDGFKVLTVNEIGDTKASKCMATVAAATYIVSFRDGKELDFTEEDVEKFLTQDEIIALKESKKSTREINLKENIYFMEKCGSGIKLYLAASSSDYTKPELVVEAFSKFLGQELQDFALMVKRLEMFGRDDNDNLVPMNELR